MSDLIFITGATGNVGAEIVRQLSELDHHVRVAQRNLQSSSNWSPSSTVEYVNFDFKQPQTFAKAFQGVKRVFLMRPPALSEVKTYMYPAIDSAIASGVEQIVFLSVLGAESNGIIPHAKVEKYIQSVGIPYTFLRASFFMQNLSTIHRQDIQRNEIFLPAGKGKTSFIDVRDIAAVAVRTLIEDGHQGRAYALTGAEALTYYEVADIFTSVLGKSIRYNPSLLKFVRQMRFKRLPIGFILVMVAIYTSARLGLAGNITPDTEQLLNRSPLTIRQYIEDYRQFWL